VKGVTARVRFLELATVGGRFYLSKGGHTCCQGGRRFDLLWGRAINLSKKLPFPHCFSSISVFTFKQFRVCAGGSPVWFHFLELATVGGRFYFSKRGLTCCQGGRHFDLLWGRAINPSKTYLFPHCFPSISRFYAILLVFEVAKGVTGLVPFS
jgi:hypothetical protein